MLTYALLAGLCVVLLSLTGTFVFRKNNAGEQMNRIVLPLAIGVFLGVVFFELLPETFEASPTWGPLAIGLGFLGFYFLSHLLSTFHHHHTSDQDACAQNGARSLLIGDSIHNLADGVVVASAFMVNPALGIMTTIGVALHEIPQEIAEFGILLRAGYSHNRSLFYNLTSASSIIVGVVLTYFFARMFTDYAFVLTGVAAGNLLFIAATDLLPELRHSHKKHFKTTFFLTLSGLIVIGALITYSHTYFESPEHSESRKYQMHI